jgi:hypothetical protein
MAWFDLNVSALMVRDPYCLSTYRAKHTPEIIRLVF